MYKLDPEFRVPDPYKRWVGVAAYLKSQYVGGKTRVLSMFYIIRGEPN